MTLQTLMYAAAKVSDEMRETIKANPDKVYFPNFGSSDNILKSKNYGTPRSEIFRFAQSGSAGRDFGPKPGNIAIKSPPRRGFRGG